MKNGAKRNRAARGGGRRGPSGERNTPGEASDKGYSTFRKKVGLEKKREPDSPNTPAGIQAAVGSSGGGLHFVIYGMACSPEKRYRKNLGETERILGSPTEGSNLSQG